MAGGLIGTDGAAPNGDGRLDARLSHLYSSERQALSPGEAFRILRRSWPFIREQRRLVIAKFALAMTSLTFFMMTPWPLKIVIDNVVDGRKLTGIPRMLLHPLVGEKPAALLVAVTIFLAAAAILVGMVGDEAQRLGTNVESGGLDQAGFTQNEANNGWSLWNGVFGYIEARLTLDLTQRLNQSLRTAIYERFLRSPLALFADQKVGDAVFRVMHDSASIGPVLYRGIFAPVLNIAMFLLTIVILYLQFPNQPLIPILAAAALPIVLVGASLFGRFLRDQSQAMRERGSDVMAAFEERIAQVQLIKAFGRETEEATSVDSASWSSYRATLRMLGIVMVLIFVLTPLTGFLVYFGLYHLMLQVISGQMTLGDVVLLGSYGMMLGEPMANLGGTWASLQAPVAGLRRVESVLDAIPEGRGAAMDGELKSIDRIEFRDVSLAYPGAAPVLSGVSAALCPGELVALAGPSGVGKTTLIMSIPRFIEPVAGTIGVNGADVRGIAPGALRARVGFVFQQEALFSTSIEDNIRYGTSGASDAAVREAAARAGAAEFIERLPEGYATMLGRRGARLSVGQKQRIAIARALLRNPDALILDEPTAPLDPASERGVIDTLRALARDRIVIIVAHRPDTLAACDRVIFLNAGTIDASGTHTELLARSAAYRAYLSVTQSEIHA
jgi:ABC-type multidrug transport system fused ATPase/permease subunit